MYCALHLFFSLVVFTCDTDFFFTMVPLLYTTVLVPDLPTPQDIIKDSFKGSLSARERAETDSGVVFSQVSPYPHHNNNEATAEEMTTHMRVASKETDMHHAVYVRMLRIQNARRAELREALDYWYVCLWGDVWGMCGGGVRMWMVVKVGDDDGCVRGCGWASGCVRVTVEGAEWVCRNAVVSLAG